MAQKLVWIGWRLVGVGCDGEAANGIMVLVVAACGGTETSCDRPQQ
ncbi:elongation of very long chain fatty acids protein 1-like protein [Corchorus olitorius]|uniref:Elongation of very long chain fatty acids protein 1-like protein n=1 Tax=Corchorus olitorius TaxID=93759 RepID=A0A1R3GH78_9ROSI|nr:elongation of very long chain fatty acids protein 1-like protein [Corchorus olitorius]